MRTRQLVAIAAVATVTLLGSIVYFVSHAATPFVALEVESGSIKTPALSIADTTASTGKAVQFKAATVPAGGSTVKPSAATTGVPAGKALTTVNGNVTVTANGTVIDGQYIKGFLVVKASNVIVRNSHVEGGVSNGVVSVIDMQSGSNNLLEDVTVTVAHPAAGIDSIHGGGYTGRRLNISGGTDGMKVDSDTTIEDSYIHDMTYYASDPSHNGGPSHNDAVQILSGSNITLRGNNLDARSQGANAAIQVTQDYGAVTNLNIAGNWADGGGCTFNIANTGSKMTVNVNGNKFGHNSGYANCPVLLGTGTTLVGTGNVWEVAPNAGAAVPVQQHD